MKKLGVVFLHRFQLTILLRQECVFKNRQKVINMVTWNRVANGLAAYKKNKELTNYLHLFHICSKRD